MHAPPHANLTNSRTLWSRIVRALLIAVICFLFLVLGSVVLFMWACTPPSVESLAGKFADRRSALEKLVVMSDADSRMLAIDPDWLETAKGQCHEPCGEAGFTPARWNEYRRLFEKAGLSQGLRRASDSGDIFLIVQSFGLLERGTSSGYLHCGRSQLHQYAPCSSALQSGEHPYSPGHEAYSFRKVGDGWYAFTQGPG